MEENKVYIKIKNYKDLLDLFELLRKKFNDLKLLMDNVKELKEREDEMISDWESRIKEVEKKIDFVDERLEPE